MFGLNQQFAVCTEVTFAIPSPRGIFQDNKVISFEQSKKKKSKKLQTSVFSQGRHQLLLTMVWAGMCLFQLDESICPCQESFTFPIFPQLLYPALALYLLIIFISWMCWLQLCHLPHFCFSLPTSLSDIIQVRSGWEKTHNLESLVRYNSKNKSLRSEKNDRQLASYDLDCSPGVLPLFSMRSGLGTWLQWEVDLGHVVFHPNLPKTQECLNLAFPWWEHAMLVFTCTRVLI